MCVEHMCVAVTDAAANCTVECVDNFSLLNLMDLIRTIRHRAQRTPIQTLLRYVNCECACLHMRAVLMIAIFVMLLTSVSCVGV